MKFCKKCNKEKPFEEFRLRKKDGYSYLNSSCKKCESDYKNDYYKNNPERHFRKTNPETKRICDNRRDTKSRKEIDIRYISKVCNIPPDVIKNHPDFIEGKRVLLKLKRLIKDNENL